MYLNPSEGLVSVLAALFPKQSNASISLGESPAPEFEQILAKLSAVFADLSQRQRHAVALPGASGGQNRDFGSVEDGEVLESLRALREYVETALQDLRAEAVGVGQQLPQLSSGLGQPGVPATENAREPLEDLKALRTQLKAALRSAVGQTQLTAERPGEEAIPALRLIEALSQWIGQYQPDSPSGTVESPAIDDSKAEELAPVGDKVQTGVRQVAEEAKAILAAGEAQLWPFLSNFVSPPFEAVPAETNNSPQATPALLSSSDDEPKPALGLVSRFKEAATETEVLRPADTTLPVKPGLVSESALPGGSPQPDILVPDGSPRQDPQGGQIGPDLPSHGGELLSSLTPGKVAESSPAFPLAPQSGDKIGLELKSLLTSPEWADELGQRLIWMHGKSVQAAEIHLNPPQLGPMAVRIQMHDDQTSIQFASPHAAVREAIEAALPRLKELFNAQQLPLTHVEVSQQSLEDRSHARREQSHASARDYQASAQEDGLEESGKESRRLEVNVGSRLLNLYV